jgi:uncharacterized protein
MVLLAFSLTTIANSQSPTPSPSTTVIYVGGYGVPGAFVYTAIELVDAGGAVSGKMRQGFDRTDAPPLQDIITNGEKLTFNVGHLYFVLERTAYGYSGFVRDQKARREQKAEFIKRRTPTPREILAAYEGTYQIDQKRTLTLSLTNGGFFLELPSGRTGALYKMSDDGPSIELTAGPCMYCIKPEYLNLRLEKSQRDAAKIIQIQIGGSKYSARRLTSYREEEVTFISKDGTQLAGSLLLPSGTGQHPAVVFAHGSNAQTRNGYYGNIRFIAEAYARSGIAALIFDKRGTGRSKGDWQTANFEILADDVAAGVGFLRTRAEIRADRIGLTGSSQAGWIMAWAAMRVPDVRFIQMRSSSPMSVREANRDQLILMMEAERYPRSEIQRALDIRDMMDDYAVTGQNWEQLEAAAKQVENEYWMIKFIGGLPGKDSPDHAWLRKAFSYDTTSTVRNFKGAWQVTYGASDIVVAVPEARAWFENALRYGRSNDVTIEVVPNADHNYYETNTGLDHREFPGYSRYAPGIFDKITRWANERMRNTYNLPLSPRKSRHVERDPKTR